MKCCFMFTCKKNAELISQFLERELKIKADVDSHMGYPIIYVEEESYEQAIIKGSEYAVKNKIGCWWLDKDQRRDDVRYVLIAYAEIFKDCKESSGIWKRTTKKKIKALAEKASKKMNRKVTFEITPCYDVRFYIERTPEIEKFQYAYREMFSLTFASSVENVVFKRAVLCDYFGEHVFQIKDVEDSTGDIAEFV